MIKPLFPIALLIVITLPVEVNQASPAQMTAPISKDFELILPSHGSEITEPLEDLRKLKSRLMNLQEKLAPNRAGRWNWHYDHIDGIPALADGIKFYLIADGSSINREGYMRSSIHCYNGISTHTGLIKTAQSFYEANPYICLPAKITMSPDQEKQVVVLNIINRTNHSVSGKIWLKSSDQIEFKKKIVNYVIEPGENGAFPIIIKAKDRGQPGTHILTADIEFDKTFFGEFPQGYIIIDE